MSEFERVAILGPGLLGGSIALAWEQQHGSARLSLWARKAARVTELRNHGFESVSSDLATAIEGAELILLAVPVGSMEDLVKNLLAVGIKEGVLVTDVGSVKGLPHRRSGTLLSEAGVHFIGSHPMAGSEQNGFEAARADLLQGAPCILTNDENVPEEILTRLLSFWSGLGARAVVMTAREHDQLVARISHLPHTLAVVCALVGIGSPEDGRLAGGGLRDTSRVAAGDPALWAEILLENREAVVDPLRESAQVLERLIGLIEENNEQALTTVLEEARQRRVQMNQEQQS